MLGLSPYEAHTRVMTFCESPNGDNVDAQRGPSQERHYRSLWRLRVCGIVVDFSAFCIFLGDRLHFHPWGLACNATMGKNIRLSRKKWGELQW